jgi:hypothetical protein
MYWNDRSITGTLSSIPPEGAAMWACKGVRSVAFRVLWPAFGFYTITMTIYNNVSTAGGTTKVLVTVERIERGRS